MTRLGALYRVVPVEERVDLHAASFVRKLKRWLEKDTQDHSKNEEKVRRHATTTRWILDTGYAPPRLKSIALTNRSRKEIQDKAVETWNRRGEEGERSRNRELPKIKWAEELPLLKAKGLRGEHRRLGAKWYIGKFPIPRRGTHTLEIKTEFKECMRRAVSWSPQEERKVKEILEKLDS